MDKSKKQLRNLLEDCLEYCRVQNGMPYCKNCGLGNEALILLDNIVDWKEEYKKDLKNYGYKGLKKKKGLTKNKKR